MDSMLASVEEDAIPNSVLTKRCGRLRACIISRIYPRKLKSVEWQLGKVDVDKMDIDRMILIGWTR